VPTDTWARQSFEDVQITTLTLDAGGTWSELAFDGCTVVTTAAGSVDVQLTYRNCTLGAMLTSSGVSFDGCTFLPGVTLQLDGGATFLGCTFGAGVIVGSPVSMDRESEVSLLEHGGSLALVTSLDGWGVAQPTPDSNADIDFSTFITRAYLEATKLTGNVTKNVTNTGTTKDGQIYVFENYNTTGFTCTLGYSEGVGSTTFVVGTERVRLVFRYDGVADGVFLQSWAKIGDT
jgi:hypothetical protein